MKTASNQSTSVLFQMMVPTFIITIILLSIVFPQLLLIVVLCVMI